MSSVTIHGASFSCLQCGQTFEKMARTDYPAGNVEGAWWYRGAPGGIDVKTSSRPAKSAVKPALGPGQYLKLCLLQSGFKTYGFVVLWQKDDPYRTSIVSWTGLLDKWQYAETCPDGRDYNGKKHHGAKPANRWPFPDKPAPLPQWALDAMDGPK